MALVYEARRESLAGVSPRVAIKLILPEHAGSNTFREMFINEARLGAAMHHQNLVQIQDFDADGDRYFLVMEYVEGITLRRIVSLCARNNIQVPLGVIAEIGRQSCDGLHYAHQARDDDKRHLRLVHRDIKPSNLILNPQGVVKVLDFGISKGRLRQERKGSVKGTWGYMAPEQAFGRDVGPEADVFGLGVVLYEMAALRPMFQAKEQAEIKRLLNDDHAARMAATLPDAYGPLISVLVRSLQRDPKARYRSAEAFGRDLSKLLPDPITARDEVVDFFQMLEALREGKPVPPPRPLQSISNTAGTSLSQAPLSSHQGTETTTGLSAALIVTAVIGVSLVMVVVAGLILAGLVTFKTASDTVASGTPGSAITSDEPAGPAGADAPGEEKSVPKGKRGRRTPRGSVGEPKPQPAESSEPAPKKVIRVPVVREQPQPVAAPAPGPVPQPAVAPAPQPAGDPGVLLIGSIQPGAEVYIEGKFVKKVPVKKDVAAGSYVVTIVATDGRRKSFRVEVGSGAKVRKVWDFDRGQWR